MTKAVTDTTFANEVLNTKGIVLVDVSAEWCGPCKALAPIIEEISQENKDRVKVVTIDVDKNQQVPATYRIMSIPALLFFKDGQLIDQQIGLISKQALQEKLNTL